MRLRIGSAGRHDERPRRCGERTRRRDERSRRCRECGCAQRDRKGRRGDVQHRRCDHAPGLYVAIEFRRRRRTERLRGGSRARLLRRSRRTWVRLYQRQSGPVHYGGYGRVRRSSLSRRMRAERVRPWLLHGSTAGLSHGVPDTGRTGLLLLPMWLVNSFVLKASRCARVARLAADGPSSADTRD